MRTVDTAAPLTERQPVLLAGYIAGVIVAVGTFLLQWGNGGDWRISLGTALLGGAVPAGTAHVAKEKAWAPATVNQLIDAEAVLKPAEG